MSATGILAGDMGGGAILYAAFDQAARFCATAPAERKFAALLTPYRTEDDARAALVAAGAAGISRVPERVGV